MTIDKEKLKELAEAAPDGFSAPQAYEDDRFYSDEEIAFLDFLEAATPAAILALLTEIERLSPPAGQVSYQQQMEAWKSASSQDLRARGELMIQVEELEAENEALRKQNEELPKTIQAQLEAFLGEAKRDAERYRWLRSRDLETISQGGVFAGITPQNMVLNEETLDQAVDAAMTKEKIQ